MKIPRVRRRIVNRVDTVTKEKLLQIMQELEPGITRKACAQAYDRVTAAINGWLIAMTRELPRGVHARLLLANCISVNLCWVKGKPGTWADYPTWWLGLTAKARAALHRQRAQEYHRWVAQGKP